MHLVLSGCEYSGTTTLAAGISQWAEGAMGRKYHFHDHWKIPHLRHGLPEEEQEQILALSPYLKESYQRFHMSDHMQEEYYLLGAEETGDISDGNHLVVGMHIDEAVYSNLYYGYGGEGEFGDRIKTARRIEKRMVSLAPDTVYELLTCAPEVIRKRMKEATHTNGLVQDTDVELVLRRFEEEYERSLINNKFTIDTSTATVEECVAEFLEKYEPFMTVADRTRILVHTAPSSGANGCRPDHLFPSPPDAPPREE